MAEQTQQFVEMQHRFALELERFRSEVQTQTAQKDRIREEILRWANPILEYVNSLHGRLRNIVKHKGYLALKKEFHHPQWSVDYDQFMSSALYAFASYFFWVGRLRQALSFELFKSQADKDAFFAAIDAVSSALRSYPPKGYSCSGADVQVFTMQQRAVGEVMTFAQDHSTCTSYHLFLMSYEKPPFSDRLGPLRSLLEGVSPDDDCRWKRLCATYEAVAQLRTFCQTLLNLDTAEGSPAQIHGSH